MTRGIGHITSQPEAIRNWLQKPVQARALHWFSIGEICLILLWALYVGRAYLDMNPDVWPGGREFGMSIQPHYIWTQFKTCGLCALWNGFNGGGYPAFIELHAAVLHPLVIISTLIWGGINGVKMVLVGSFAMAGLGQWWLARVLGLGPVARLWSAAMVIVGGHLAGKMEIGVVGAVVSTAACSLVLAPSLKLASSGRRRDAIVLSLFLALAIVSGQGYLQLGLLFGVLPALAVFFVGDRLELRPVWKEFLLAGGLSLLLAALFLVPLLHFWPQFGKQVDTTFSGVQPIQYVLLNLVISDVDFYFSDALRKVPYPYASINFIGWIPVLLALLTLRLARRSEQRLLTFFWIAIGLVLLVSSAGTFKFLYRFLPVFSAGVRTASLAAGLLVPLVMALAAWGLDRMLKLNWPVLILAPSETNAHPRLTLRLSWLVMALVIGTSLVNAYRFGQKWIRTEIQEQGPQQVVEAARTTGAQWVALPYGEHFWGPLAAEAGLKQTGYVRPWFWLDRTQPSAALEASRGSVDTSANGFLRQVDGVNLVRHAENSYSFVMSSDEGSEPCIAMAQGGNIDVSCQTGSPGTLIVRENNRAGWRVSMDDQPAPIGDEPWLSTPAPAGKHLYSFRYRPWDVTVGFALSLLGFLIGGWLWLRSGDKTSEERGAATISLLEHQPDP
jgi:hypothetical protein